MQVVFISRASGGTRAPSLKTRLVAVNPDLGPGSRSRICTATATRPRGIRVKRAFDSRARFE
jgi:hypothetical protein